MTLIEFVKLRKGDRVRVVSNRCSAAGTELITLTVGPNYGGGVHVGAFRPLYDAEWDGTPLAYFAHEVERIL